VDEEGAARQHGGEGQVLHEVYAVAFFGHCADAGTHHRLANAPLLFPLPSACYTQQIYPKAAFRGGGGGRGSGHLWHAARLCEDALERCVDYGAQACGLGGVNREGGERLGIGLQAAAERNVDRRQAAGDELVKLVAGLPVAWRWQHGRTADVNPPLPVGGAQQQRRVRGDNHGDVAVVGEGQRKIWVVQSLHADAFHLRRRQNERGAKRGECRRGGGGEKRCCHTCQVTYVDPFKRHHSLLAMSNDSVLVKPNRPCPCPM
jgi:hypothetical protein